MGEVVHEMLGDYIDVTEGIDNPLLYAFVPYAACCLLRDDGDGPSFRAQSPMN